MNIDKKEAAKILGKLRGQKGGIARAKALSDERRSEIAKLAAKTRWQSHKEPDTRNHEVLHKAMERETYLEKQIKALQKEILGYEEELQSTKKFIDQYELMAGLRKHPKKRNKGDFTVEVVAVVETLLSNNPGKAFTIREIMDAVKHIESPGTSPKINLVRHAIYRYSGKMRWSVYKREGLLRFSKNNDN